MLHRAVFQAFEAQARKLRASIRIRPAEEIHDLTDRIMDAVAASGAPARVPLRSRRSGGGPRPVRTIAPVAAALVVGLVAGSLAVGGPWQRPSTRPIAAADLVRGIASAARTLDAYHATFAITEHGLPGVGIRHLTMDVSFLSPGRYRLDVVDRTRYPTPRTPTDLRFIANGAATYQRGPTGCPAGIDPRICPPVQTVTTVRRDFSPQAPLPTDLVLPLDVLSSPRGVTVMGTGTVLGRPAVEVQLTVRRAAPLFPFLRLGGTWRPFFPADRVVLWLDRSSWFPLRYTVYPSSDPGRVAWELRFGLSREDSSRPIFDVSATAFSTTPPPADAFSIPRSGADVVPIADLRDSAGFQPIIPIQTADLRAPTSAVVAPDGGGARQTLITYSSGLTYLHVGQLGGGAASNLFDATAERVVLPGVGVAYYQPATADLGRRLLLRTDEGIIALETNLSREELLQVAASLPVRSEGLTPQQRTARVGASLVQVVTLADARRRAPFRFSPPASLPPGYVLSSALLTRLGGTIGVTLLYRQADSDLVGAPIRLHMEPAARLPAAASAQPAAVSVAGARGRWSPDLSKLEWLRDGVYYSLDAPGLELEPLLAIALSIPQANA